MAKKEKKKDDDRALDQAKAQLRSVAQMVNELNAAIERGDDKEAEEAREAINQDALSVEIRGGWRTPGSKSEDEEFLILLCTGGPAARLIGELGQFNTPETVRLQYQDWFTPWTDYPLSSEEEQILLQYCQQFYFGY